MQPNGKKKKEIKGKESNEKDIEHFICVPTNAPSSHSFRNKHFGTTNTKTPSLIPVHLTFKLMPSIFNGCNCCSHILLTRSL